VTESRRTRITIESERLLIVAKREPARAWCERCGVEVELVKPGIASRVWERLSENRGRVGPGRLLLQFAKRGLVIRLKSTLRFLRLGGSDPAPSIKGNVKSENIGRQK
jgi:hypothetical protein